MKRILVLIVSSGFILLSVISQLILSSYTSLAFIPQQPTAVQQQQNTSQLNQSALQPSQQQQPTAVQQQQNTSQLNQSALQPSQQQQPTAVQQQQKISLEELKDSEDFIASGIIDSIIYTINGNWKANGNWKLTVSDGELTSFDTDMAWNNGTAAHTHEFQNFEVNDDNDGITVDSEGSVIVEGEMDVGTNGVISWPKIPAGINIEKGKIITVSLDDKDTNHHFGGQTVHGSVTLFKSCSVKPGASMQVPTGGCS
jgi:hypothetical protein